MHLRMYCTYQSVELIEIYRYLKVGPQVGIRLANGFLLPFPWLEKHAKNQQLHCTMGGEDSQSQAQSRLPNP